MSGANQTIKLKSADWSLLRFSEKKLTKNAKGTDNVFITYGPASAWLYVQLPLLRMPFDPQENEDGSVTFTMSLDKSNPRHADAIEKLREFDSAILAHLGANSQELVNKARLDDAWKESKYVNFLKIKLDDEDQSIEKYHNIKVKLPAKDGVVTTTAYEWMPRASDPTTEVAIKDYLLPHCHVEAIVRPARIWFQKTGKVGVTFTAEFVRIKPVEDRNAGPRFVADSDAEDDLPAAPVPAATATTSADADDMSVDDTEVVGDADEAPVVVKPASVSARGRKPAAAAARK